MFVGVIAPDTDSWDIISIVVSVYMIWDSYTLKPFIPVDMLNVHTYIYIVVYSRTFAVVFLTGTETIFTPYCSIYLPKKFRYLINIFYVPLEHGYPIYIDYFSHQQDF